MRVEIDEARVYHRDPQRLPLADGGPGLDVAERLVIDPNGKTSAD